MLTTFAFVASDPIPGGMAITVLGAFFGWFLVAAVVALAVKLFSLAGVSTPPHLAARRTPAAASTAGTVAALAPAHTHRPAA